MSLVRSAALALATVVLCPSLLLAQPAATAVPSAVVRSLEVVVRDGSGAVVPGATLVLVTPDTGQTRVSTTDAAGRATLALVRTTRIELTCSAPGFAADVRAVDPGAAPAAIEVVLTPAIVVDQVTVVSGSRQEELREQTSAAVTVVSAARMRDTGYESVGEVLREVPGVLTRRGSESSAAAGEQIQGIDSRGVLVLLDGLPLVGARGIKRGVLNLDRQSVGRLDRVEVVKGASSALYGSDAIGGVINLITRDVRRPFESLFTVAAGSEEAFDVRGEAGVQRGTVSAYGTVERHQRDAWDLTPTTPDTTGADFGRTDALAKVTFQLRPDLRLTALGNGYANRSRGRSVGEVGVQSDDAHDSAQNVAARAEWQIRSTLALEARGYYARYDETADSVLFATNAPLERGELYERYSRADATLRWQVGGLQLVQGGVEWTRDDYRGHNRLRDDRGHTADTSVFWIQDQVSLKNRVTVTGGLRYDNHSIFGDAWSPKLGVNVRATDDLRLRASYGRGFRAPDLGQLYYRFLNPTSLYQVLGNPSLQPERSGSVQVGGDYSWRRRARVGVNLFHNDVDDMIESVNLGFIASPAQLQAIMAAEGIDASFRPQLQRLLFLYKNLTDVRTQGVEIDGDVALAAGFSVSGAYTWLQAEDRVTGLALTGRHPHQGSVRLGWETQAFGGWRANLRGAFYSDWIQSRSAAGVEVDGERFALWDLYVAKPIARGFECYGAVDNFTNSQDPNTGVIGASGAPAAIYRPEIGRTVRFGVRWGLGR
jgi:outer membrane receptor for ferrienterochelin and colicins